MSPDEDFSPAGQKSGMMYDKLFAAYKKTITKNLEDSQSSEHRLYKRIVAKFSIAVFGAAPPSSNDFVVDNGEYDSEIERFNKDARAESPVESDDDVEVDTPSRLSAPPVPPLQSDHRVSISVASHVSHTIAALSQVSNVINNNVTLPLGRDPTEPSPLIQAPSRPLPKKAINASKTTSEDPTPATASDKSNKKTTRKTKTAPTLTSAPEEATSRVLRKRG